jgi:hypothetical protein
VGHLADELYEAFLEPAVLGQTAHLLQPIGEHFAGALAEHGGAMDEDRLREAQIRLVAAARKLVPVDLLAPPTEADWRLFVAWHDLFVAAHPDWNQPLRRDLAKRVLGHALATAQRVRPPQTVSEALTRHLWTAAITSMVRIDTTVTWWTGSEVCRGTEPPERLLRFAALRRVEQRRVTVESSEFAAGSALADEVYQRVYASCLALSPLTDIATAHRDSPPFAWNEASLALVTTVAGRRLATRAIRQWTEPSRAKAPSLFALGDVRVPEDAARALAQFVTKQFVMELD